MRSNPPRLQRATFSALIAGLLGLILAAGGVWLAALGGTWFYLLAGVLLLITGRLLWRGRASALLTYGLLVLTTLIWGLYERGLDWWGLAARGDLIFILGLALLLPPVARALLAGRSERLALGGALGLAALVGVASILAPAQGRALEGRLPGVRSLAAATEEGVAPGDWPAYGRTWRGDRYSPLAQITPANASALQQAWVFHTGDLKRKGDPDEFTYEVTPIKVDGLLYVCTPHDIVFALDRTAAAKCGGSIRESATPRICST